MGDESLEQSQSVGGAHHKLASLVGEWEGTTRVWFEQPDVTVDEAPNRGTIRPVLGGSFVLHEYEGSFQGSPLQGIALYGYNLATGTFEAAWADTFHMSTAILFSQGDNTSTEVSVLGHWDAGGTMWGWRTQLDLIGPDELVITAYIITPDGAESRGVETAYTRKQ